VPQWENNCLAVGSSFTIIKDGDNRGLFTTVDISEGAILCINNGIIINNEFLNYSDYDSSDVKVIKQIPGKLTFLMDNITIASSYTNLAKDPLDQRKCNAEFIEHSKDSYVVLKTTKKIKAYNEILISLDKKTCISKFRCEWTKTTDIPNNYPLTIKNVISAYDIKEEEAIEACTNHRIQEIIMDFIQTHMTWQTGIHYFVNVLPNIQNSCYIYSVLQCLIRIPVLSRLLLESDLFQNIDKKTFVSKYISLLKMMFTNQQPNIKQVHDFVDKREEIAEWFTPNIHQDAQEFLSFLLEKFCQENTYFEFVRHSLFTIYRESTKYCNNKKQHRSMKREIQHIL